MTDEISLPPINVVVRQNQEITSQDQSHIPACHCEKVTRLPICYCNEGEAIVAITDNDIDDPLIYKSVMEDTDKEKLQEDVKLELE